MWVIGTLVAAAGTAVYIELGTVSLPLLRPQSALDDIS